MKRQEILENVESATFVDGFDEAIIGYEPNSGKVVYDISAMVDIVRDNEKIDEDEAIDYLSYRILSAYIGDQTPIYIHKV